MIKRGYHYTSFDNWLIIKKQGLVPYKITKNILAPYLGTDTVIGIWTWRKKPSDVSHMGNVIYQFATKAKTKVVMLSYEYSEAMEDKEILYVKNGKVVLPHYGSIGEFEYHNGVDEAVIILNKIEPHKIRLENIFDLPKILSKKYG